MGANLGLSVLCELICRGLRGLIGFFWELMHFIR
jgi:hypothetical protein